MSISLTFNDPEYVTALSVGDTGPTCAWHPDGSLYVLYCVAVVGTYGLYLKRRNRDGVWLGAVSVPNAGITDPADYLDIESTQPTILNSEGWLHIDSDGSVVCFWQQAGSANRELGSNKMTQPDDENSYGTWSGYGLYDFSTVMTSGLEAYPVISYNKVDGHYWICCPERLGTPKVWAGYFDLQVSTTAYDMATQVEQLHPLKLGSSDTAQDFSTCYCDRDGNVHVAWVYNTAFPVFYAMRSVGAPEIAGQMFQSGTLLVTGITTGQTRSHVAVHANNANDVHVTVNLNHSTGVKIYDYWKGVGIAWTETQIHTTGGTAFSNTALSNWSGRQGEAFACWSNTSTDKVYYNNQDEGSWDAAETAIVTLNEGFNKTSLAMKVLNASPYQLGWLNPRVMKLAIMGAGEI